MERPYVFCHMLTSLDGKISGNFMSSIDCSDAGYAFDEIAFGNNRHYNHQGWLSGRITSEEAFTNFRKPDLITGEKVESGDYIFDTNYSMYYISVDPKGKIGWSKNTLRYSSHQPHIIELLTKEASDEYKAFLRRKHISYLIVGDNSIDFKLALEKLYQLFNIKLLMLGGGGVLNWSFIQQGLCDELSVVLAPVADGANNTPTLFETRDNYGKDIPVGFKLDKVEVIGESTLWLRYKIKN